MVQLPQIYKKAFAFNVLPILLGIALNSCAVKTTDLFLKTDNSVLNDKPFSKLSVVPIEKSCTYYFGVFSTGEYDKFDSNIYDQLRGSLLSEARYNYPDYDVQSLSQSEEKGLVKTVYKVEADLVLRKAIRDKLNLIINHSALSSVQLDSSKIKELPTAIQPLDEKIDSSITEAKPLALKEEFFGEAEKLKVLLEKVKSETSKETTTDEKKSVSDISNPEIKKLQEEEKDSDSVITELGLSNFDTVINAAHTSVKEIEKKLDYKQLERAESEEIVYIVACFQKGGDVEEKVLITEEEIGHPLKYYVTDKWIRVYLNDVRSLPEAKAIYHESWPCRYGE